MITRLASVGRPTLPGTLLATKGTDMSAGLATLTAAPQQRETLRQALADAISYPDPPLNCTQCPSPDRLCDQCTAGHERARAYLALSYEFGLETAL
jgi:hypothetical protein